MDVSITALRSNLADYVEQVRNGNELIVVQHGAPVARLSAIGSVDAIERLTKDGTIRRPTNPIKVTATGRDRIRPTPGPPISDLIAEHRNQR